MNKIIIAGIDYSMTSPAISIHDGSLEMGFHRCNHYYLSRQTSLVDKFDKNIEGFAYPDYKEEIERYLKIAKWAMNILRENDVTHVFLEGYSMGSKGKIFNIAENTAMLKAGLYLESLFIELVPPTTLKKFATGKGNSDKTKMFSHFHENEPGAIDLQNVITPKRDSIGNPVSDIVDAYYLCKYGFNELRDRGVLI